MILEAFSTELQLPKHRGRSPERVLFEWLARNLLLPPSPTDQIGRVLHHEIELLDCNGHIGFEGRTDTGRELLRNLYKYCRSYDHWQFGRWIHAVQASDFPIQPGE